MIYCLNPACPHPQNPDANVHCQYCGVRIALRDRFKALKLIGQGGFGKTYLAEDLDNRNKPCVIKRFIYQGADDYATEKARQLFEKEAERLDQLVHPQIPRLLAYFQESDYLYLVQEVIVGQTLHAELQSQGLFDETKIRAVLKGLLPVLQFVHSRSVIHRDIKPDNIMRKRHGDLVLIDFGVAKFLEESGFSQSSTTIGTPGYAAPEQIQGRVKPASDLFALGATCFQLLTDAFETSAVSTAGYGWVRKWQTYVALDISDDLAAILTRLMALEERDRYATAADVLKDLETGYAPGNVSGASPLPPSLSGIPTVAVSPASPPTSPTSSTPHSSTPHASSSSNQPTTSAPSGPTVGPPSPLGLVPPTSTPLSPGQTSAPTHLSLKAEATNVQTANISSAGGQSSSGQSSGGQFFSSQSSHRGTNPSLTAPIRKVPVSAGFWLQYGLFSYAGHAIGFIVASILVLLYVASTHPNPGNLSSSELTSVMWLLVWMHWPVAGFFVGLMQWLAIKKWLPRALWWLPATVAGFWAIALAVATGYADAFSGIVVGLLVGLPQWAAIRKHVPRAGWWVLWTMMGVAVLCHSISSDFLTAVGWLMVAPLLDGLFLSWILRQQVADST
ncbi:MAG: serine/threonine-protein kinase [Cyanobacteria bacterium J06621_11]